MSLFELKSLMKEINEPNEFILSQVFSDNISWLYKVENVRLKQLRFNLETKRKSRFTIFINGLYISERDYNVEYRDNDIYIKFMKERFPPLDRFGNVFELEESDEVRILGDLEKING